MTTPAGSDWISVPTAARRMGLTPRRVWGLVSEQRLSSVLCDGRRLISRSDVEARRKKSTETGAEFQFTLQSETAYQRIVDLEKNMQSVLLELEELRNGR